MRSPIQILFDWTKVRHVKEEFLAALRMTRPGAGITIKDQGLDTDGKPKGGGPNDPIVARAIIELLKENPGRIEALDNGATVTLMRTPDMRRSAGSYHERLTYLGGVLRAENLRDLGAEGAELPAHQFRSGRPEDYNDPMAPGSLLDADGNFLPPSRKS